MHRRLAAIVGAVALALTSVGAVSADTLGTGQFLQTSSEVICESTLCTWADTFVGTWKGGERQVCLTLHHSGEGIEYETEVGCTANPGKITKVKGGYIVAFAATSIHLDSTLGGPGRDVVVSGSYLVASDPSSSTTTTVYTDTPRVGCTTTATESFTQIIVDGTLTLDGTTLHDSGAAKNQTYRDRTRC
jgi:hypothetical protein